MPVDDFIAMHIQITLNELSGSKITEHVKGRNNGWGSGKGRTEKMVLEGGFDQNMS